MSRIRNRHLAVSDAVLLSLSPFLVYALRFEGWTWGDAHAVTAMVFTAVSVPLHLLVFWASGLYARLWRYASVAEMQGIFVTVLGVGLVCLPVGLVILPTLGLTPARVPLSALITNILFAFFFVAGPRLVWRVGGVRAVLLALIGHPERRGASQARRVLVAGAGAAGHMLVRELRDNPDLGLLPVGFIDDDPEKIGKRLANLPVYGPLSDGHGVIWRERIAELIVAMPKATGETVRPLVRAALDAGIRTRTIPGLFEIVAGKVGVHQLREIQIHDLLRREPIRTDVAAVSTLAANRTVMVTGAGGSIGSELARQIADLKPTRLLLLGHGENPIFHIINELHARRPGLPVVPIIADVRDRRRMFQVMKQHRPFAVFHAAAHKHVPLMEENVVEAVTNNVCGTRNLVEAALAADVEHFVLISTDKAVRPTSVMGTTKRVAEHIVRHAALQHGRNYVAVRFGNVLGSQGSVVPTFMDQIRAGGPVLVTHPEMRRFFMTIPEAVQLVLQAGALGKGGELFMLDMGEDVKIVDLAADLIRLSGYEVGRDIEIRFSGIRPGEKLYEEMFWGHEEAVATAHPKVLCSREPIVTWEIDLIEDLVQGSVDGVDESELRRRLHRIVPDAAWRPDAPVVLPPYTVDDEEAERASYEAEQPAVRTSGGTRMPVSSRPLPPPPSLPS